MAEPIPQSADGSAAAHRLADAKESRGAAGSALLAGLLAAALMIGAFALFILFYTNVWLRGYRSAGVEQRPSQLIRMGDSNGFCYISMVIPS